MAATFNKTEHSAYSPSLAIIVLLMCTSLIVISFLFAFSSRVSTNNYFILFGFSLVFLLFSFHFCYPGFVSCLHYFQYSLYVYCYLFINVLNNSSTTTSSGIMKQRVWGTTTMRLPLILFKFKGGYKRFCPPVFIFLFFMPLSIVAPGIVH